ncbi:MAG: hypothetical protein WCA19_24980 [Candidatus Acidiferrales bacterium]
MKAVNMSENILGKNLDNKSFWLVYERIEALNLPIFLHNLDPVSERLVEKNYTMINVLGNPFEATIAVTALVLGGIMDEFPKLDVFPPRGRFFCICHSANGLGDGHCCIFTAHLAPASGRG